MKTILLFSSLFYLLTISSCRNDRAVLAYAGDTVNTYTVLFDTAFGMNRGKPDRSYKQFVVRNDKSHNSAGNHDHYNIYVPGGDIYVAARQVRLYRNDYTFIRFSGSDSIEYHTRRYEYEKNGDSTVDSMYVLMPLVFSKGAYISAGLNWVRQTTCISNEDLWPWNGQQLRPYYKSYYMDYYEYDAYRSLTTYYIAVKYTENGITRYGWVEMNKTKPVKVALMK